MREQYAESLTATFISQPADLIPEERRPSPRLEGWPRVPVWPSFETHRFAMLLKDEDGTWLRRDGLNFPSA